jgi:hypothetical protein
MPDARLVALTVQAMGRYLGQLDEGGSSILSQDLAYSVYPYLW